MSRWSRVAFLILTIGCMASTAHAVEVSLWLDPLDPTFGSGGKVTVDRGSPYDALYDAVSLPDGGVLAGIAVWRYPTQEEFALMRLQSNGAVDTTFGDAGTATVDIGGYSDYLRRILPLPNGSILAFGYSITDRAHPSLARFTDNGSLDSSFGAGGTVLDSTSPLGEVRSGALLGDGFVIVGSTATSPYDLGVSKYQENGSPDSNFGNGGTRVFDFGLSEYGRAVVVDAELRITAIGTQFGADAPDVLAVRLTPEGELDPSFGAGGTSLVDVPDRFIPEAAALQSDGSVVLAGQLQRYPQLLGAIVRLDPSGALDSSFGSEGVVIVPESGYVTDIEVLVDDSIAAAGSAGHVDADFIAALLTRDGAFDASFGSNGVHTVDFFEAGEEDPVSALSLGPNGTMLIAGGADKLPYSWQTDFDLAFARYLLQGMEPPDGDGDGVRDASDNCPAFFNPDQADSDTNDIGDECECGDQNGDGTVDVRDIMAINAATFGYIPTSPLCDANDDALCTVSDIVGVHLKMFGVPPYCSRYPPPGP